MLHTNVPTFGLEQPQFLSKDEDLDIYIKEKSIPHLKHKKLRINGQIT